MRENCEKGFSHRARKNIGNPRSTAVLAKHKAIGTKNFQDRLVMTASITLRIDIQLKNSKELSIDSSFIVAQVQQIVNRKMKKTQKNQSKPSAFMTSGNVR